MPMKSKSRTTTKKKKGRVERLAPVHPGEILLEEFLKPLGLSQYRVAEAIHVPRRRINEIVLGQRSISAGSALRLARFLGTSDRFWLNLQSTYDLEVERDRIGPALDEIQVLQRAS
jgi:addiction module HigA family antidote